MIGSIVWYNVGGGFKTIGIITGHCKNISIGYSVWTPCSTIIEDAIKIMWIKEEGLKPTSLNSYHKMMDYENELRLAEYHYLDAQKWYNLKYFKILSKTRL